MTTTRAYDLGVRIARTAPDRADRALGLAHRVCAPETLADVWLGYDEAKAEDAPRPVRGGGA